MKRVFDLSIALLMLVPSILVSIPIAVAIRLDSPGSALFRQIRVGRNRRPFTLLKWRTMSIDTGDLPSHEANRAKITRIGGLLRRTKLDELPQIWNVLVGEMSLVGPRPCLPTQTELVDERERLGVLALRPGITGLSQIAGLDMSDPIRLAAADAQYLQNTGMLVDICIILRTAFQGIFRDAVGNQT